MTKREEAISAIAHAIADGPNPSSATWQSATAAFDAAIKVLMEPDESMFLAYDNAPDRRDGESWRVTARNELQAMLKAASA